MPEIAARFSLSERTIESHVSALLRKLGAANRIELVPRATELAGPRAAELPAMLQMSARRSMCVGRDEERAALLGCWEHAARGQTALVVLHGARRGIGSSRLAAELATHVHAQGGHVLLGASTDGSDVPYQPFVEALTATIRESSEHHLRADMGPHAEVLARLIPVVAARLGMIPPVIGLDPLGERQAAHDALTAFVAQTAVGVTLTLLVIEDLHWATTVTRDAVLHLSRAAGSAALLVLVTTRRTPHRTSIRRSFDGSPTRCYLPMCTTVPLGGLDVGASAELIADLRGRNRSRRRPARQWRESVVAPRVRGRRLREPDAARPHGRSLRASPTTTSTSSTPPQCSASRSQPTSWRPHRATRSATCSRLSYERRVPGWWSRSSTNRRGPAFVRRVVPFIAVSRDDARSPHAVARGRRRRGSSPRAEDPAVLPELARHACIAAPLRPDAPAVELSTARAGIVAALANDLEAAAADYQPAARRDRPRFRSRRSNSTSAEHPLGRGLGRP